MHLKAMGYLPVEGQAKLARFWSKYEPKRLQAILETLQQLITVRIITGSFAGTLGSFHVIFYSLHYGLKCDIFHQLCFGNLVWHGVSMDSLKYR
jgi:hypothetical protein